MVWGLNSGRGRSFLFYKYVQTRLWGPPTLKFNWVMWSLFLEEKQPGREVDYSAPPSAEVKNEWSYTSIPTLCLQGECRDITFYFVGLLSVYLITKKNRIHLRE
jgi:hypothetical protein